MQTLSPTPRIVRTGVAVLILVVVFSSPLPPLASAVPRPNRAQNTPAASPWQIETVDGGGGQPAPHVNLATDPFGRLHWGYLDGQGNGSLRHLFHDGLRWQLTTAAAAGAGQYNDLAVDGQGRPHLSYLGQGHLRYAWYDGQEWHDQTVDATARPGSTTAIALDTAGRPHIAYYDDTYGSERLRYAYYDGSSWVHTTVATGSGVGLHLALTLDDDDHAHLAYYSQPTGDLNYAYHDGGGLEQTPGWQIETVDDEGITGKYPALALDGAGYPHISYYVDFPDHDLRHAWRDAGQSQGLGQTPGLEQAPGWQIETVDAGGDVGRFTALALDSADRAHIAYYDDAGQEIAYAVQEGGVWYTQTVAPLTPIGADDAHPLDLTLGAGEELCIGYADGEGGLGLACRSGSAWQHQAPARIGAAGQFASIQWEDPARPHIAYLNQPLGELRYACYEDGSSGRAGWQLQTVDTPLGDSAGHSTLALDGAGHPHIAYFSGLPDGDLRYARFGGPGPGWQIETVDAGDPPGAGRVGEYASLALDGAGRPHISYYDAANHALKYAYDGGFSKAESPSGGLGQAPSLGQAPGWQITTVDGDGGQYTSLALDGAGRPHIAYKGDGGLNYARHDGNSWQIEVVDSSGGDYASLALDGAGRPHIAYSNGATLNYARHDGNSWQIEVVDSGGSADASLALDGAGRPHIAYSSGATLNYARHDGNSWQIEVVDSSGGADASLALDSAGHPRIGSYNASDGTLRYAYALGAPPSTWTRLVYISLQDDDRGEIYTAAGDGAQPTRVTTNEAIDAVPQLSRGATRIAFATYRDWNMEIYNMLADGSNPTRLTNHQASDYAPAWSPDGSQIAFHANRDGDYEVFTMNADGGGLTQLTHNGHWDGYPAWSPDGDQIVFVSNRSGADTLWVMDTGGGGQSELTPGLEEAGYPAWSPDGGAIAFSCRGNGDGWDDLALVDADGSDLHFPLGYSESAEERLHPAWAPYGGGLAFSHVLWSDAGGDWEIISRTIRFVDLAGGSTSALLDGGHDWWPHWQTQDTAAPTSQAHTLPAWSSPLVVVSWGGQDDGPAGLGSYDVQVRDGAGPWSDWLLGTSQGAGLWIGEHDHLYRFRARARDRAFNLEPYPAGSETETRVDAIAPSSAASSPTYPGAPTFSVWWGGSDAGSDIASYDVQVRDGTGPWSDWLLEATATTAPFEGQEGHTYRFRARARDQVGNLEPYPGTADTSTTVDTVAPSSTASSPAYANSVTFTVTWSGTDATSGIASYDVQVRDGAGPWTDWLLTTTATTAPFDGQEGHTYHFRCRAHDRAGNLEPYPGTADASTTVDTIPPDSAAASPAQATALTFIVTWSGTDATSGIASYDVQVRDGAGPWTDWRLETTQSAAPFTGELGHDYYFQCRARDEAGNEEAYPGGDGDTVTAMPNYALPGYVRGNRDQPIAQALIEATPVALAPVYSAIDGAFTLFFNLGGAVDLTVSRSGFGGLPPMQDVPVGETPLTVTLYLPPADDVVTDGGFEAGDLAAWQTEGQVALTGTAHTGDYGLQLGGPVPAPVVTPTEPFSASTTITEAGGRLRTSWATVVVPAGAVSGTAIISLTAVPSVTGLPSGTQEIGLQVAWQVALTDGAAITATDRPATLTLSYDDAAWQAAQVAGEDTLGVWRYDHDGENWIPLSGTLDTPSNAITVTTDRPGTLALLGTPYEGPWCSTLEQTLDLSPTMTSGTLSLLYQVMAAEPSSDTLVVIVRGADQALTGTLALTASGWMHRWWDLPDTWGPTATVHLRYAQARRERAAGAAIEEISLGSPAVGGYGIYLPLVARN